GDGDGNEAGRYIGLSGSETGFSYQLKLNDSAIGSPKIGNGAAINFGKKYLAGVYSILATNPSTGCSINMSNTVTIIVYRKPNPSVTPASQTICTGTAIATITSTDLANQTGTTYTWTRSNTNNLTGINANGTGAAITGSLTNITSAQQKTTFTITAISACGTKTQTVTVTVNTNSTISGQPANQSKNVGQTASFTANATGSIVSYQWEQSTNNGVSWTTVNNGGNITGATSNNLRIANLTLTQTGNKYHCNITPQCGNALVSNNATLTVGSCNNNHEERTNANVSKKMTAGAAQQITANLQAGVSPNPTSGRFNLVTNQLNIGKAQIKILNAQGLAIQSMDINIVSASQTINLNIETAAKGIYYVQIVQNNQVKTYSLTKY
ncbi:MAG: T9SS type A sorting domain-containing protein, partial [Chitinophagaceae bacterium]